MDSAITLGFEVKLVNRDLAAINRKDPDVEATVYCPFCGDTVKVTGFSSESIDAINSRAAQAYFTHLTGTTPTEDMSGAHLKVLCEGRPHKVNWGGSGLVFVSRHEVSRHYGVVRVSWPTGNPAQSIYIGYV